MRPLLTLIALSPLAAFPAAAQPAQPNGPAPAPTQQTAPAQHPGRMAQRFARANTTGDGRLTLAQAQAGDMPMVAKHFSQIDSTNKGYITLDEIRAFSAAHRRAPPPQ